MLNGKTVLITGGTGSLGNALVKRISEDYTPKKVILFSRCEYKQAQMLAKYKNLRWLRALLGDVRDVRRLMEVTRNVDYVIHAAALKRIDTLEYCPLEAVKTNINGTANVIEACVNNGVKRAIFTSTDKACCPINLYGATKLAAEKIWTASNSFNETEFAFVRYGNVLGSRGSVIELFMKLKEEGVHEFPITDMEMTRFFLTLEDAAELVLRALKTKADRIIPRLPSMKITSLARAIDPECTFKVIGIRPGEKLAEMLEENYSSDKNDVWLTAKEIQKKLGIDVGK